MQEANRIALLIDCDNVTPNAIEGVLEELAKHGTVNVRHAHGDWKNPYASKLKKPVTIRLSEDVIDYFKGMAEESGVPYQSLINLYLRDCASQNRKVDIQWQP